MTLDEWIAWLNAGIAEAEARGAGPHDEVVTLRVRTSPRVGRLVGKDGERSRYAFTILDLRALLRRAENRKFAADLAREAAG